MLEALADEAVQKHTEKDSKLAIQYLMEAIERGGTNPFDFEELATLLIGSARGNEALDVLLQGMKAAPYDVKLYHQYAKLLLQQNRTHEACEFVSQAAKEFPQDDSFRDFQSRCAANVENKSKN